MRRGVLTDKSLSSHDGIAVWRDRGRPRVAYDGRARPGVPCLVHPAHARGGGAGAVGLAVTAGATALVIAHGRVVASGGLTAAAPGADCEPHLVVTSAQARAESLTGSDALTERGVMNDDRVLRLLEEIRDLQQRLLEAYQQALRNQQEAIAAQRTAIARTRKLQVAIGIVIAVVFVVVLVLLNYVIRRYG